MGNKVTTQEEAVTKFCEARRNVMKETLKLLQDDEKQIDTDTHIVNLTEHRIIARVCKDKVNHKTVNWRRKQRNLILISKHVTTGIVEGIGSINIMDTHQQPEGQETKCGEEGVPDSETPEILTDAGFEIIASLKSITFPTKNEFNYVSIYANGVCKLDDIGTKDREIYVDRDCTVGSNAIMTIADKYNDDLFSYWYPASMVGTLNDFKFSDHHTFYMDLYRVL